MITPPQRDLIRILAARAVREHLAGQAAPSTTLPEDNHHARRDLARCSTDRQSESSVQDQLRVCRGRVADIGAEVVATHYDDAVSGSTPVGARRGGQADPVNRSAIAGRSL